MGRGILIFDNQYFRGLLIMNYRLLIIAESNFFNNQ